MARIAAHRYLLQLCCGALLAGGGPAGPDRRPRARRRRRGAGAVPQGLHAAHVRSSVPQTARRRFYGTLQDESGNFGGEKQQVTLIKRRSIPEEGIQAAVEVMRGGRLFRYCATSAETSQVAQAEKEFAAMVNQKYALGVNSCSSAIMLALMAVGVEPGDQVITNGFTFTALPSTIMRLGAEPVLVEATKSWIMDLDDLEKKIEAFPDAKVLLLSHMRGKVADMDRVVEICEKNGITLVEDCAHPCGVTWRGKQLGYHAKVTAYSTQSDKVINSGEGGFVTTDDDEIAAKMIYLSGCYERRYGKHAVRPPDDLCEVAMAEMPNLSCRMNEVTAAVMRPLIKNLPQRVEAYNRRYDAVVQGVKGGGRRRHRRADAGRARGHGRRPPQLLPHGRDGRAERALPPDVRRHGRARVLVPVQGQRALARELAQVRLADLRPAEHGRGPALRLRPQDAAVL